jgi:hypothetical protein
LRSLSITPRREIASSLQVPDTGLQQRFGRLAAAFSGGLNFAQILSKL